MTYLLKFLPLALVAVNWLGIQLSPDIAGFWAHHAQFANIATAIALFLPQPHK